MPERPDLPPGFVSIRDLGRGRLGTTSLCRDASGNEVVVTVLEVRQADERSRKELDSELRAAAAAFAHPCAVPVRLAGGDDQPLFLTQPYLAGGALGTDPSGPDMVTVGGMRLTAALAQAHLAGMLHGDVRPSNVLRTSDGAWMLAAGGVAHAVGRAGSDAAAQPDPLFAAPEHFSGEQPGVAADVYSLGATLYTALVGEAPHASAAREGPGALHAARLGPPPELPMSVPAGLAALIRRMLAPDPAERPVLNEVDHVLRALAPAGTAVPPPVPARVVSAPPRPAVRLAVTEPAAVAAASKRRTLVAGVAIGALFLAGAGAVAATNSGSDDTPELVAGRAAPPPLSETSAPPAPAPDVAQMRVPEAAAAGLVPVRIQAFVYNGLLSVLWEMSDTAPEVQGFALLSVDPKRSTEPKLQPKKIGRSERASTVYVYFYDSSVPPKHCALIRSERNSGPALGDPRPACPQKFADLSAIDKQRAEKVYREKFGAPQNTRPRAPRPA